MGEPYCFDGVVLGEGPYVAGYDADTGETVDVPVGALPEEPVRIPLVVYINEQKKIIGDAVVKGGHIEAHFDPNVQEPIEEVAELIQVGIIQNVSIEFNAPPAVPLLRDGTIRWVKSY
jgi:hypothetical protein